MIWKPSPKAIQAAAEAYISDKGIKAVLEAAINVDRPIVDLSAIRTGRSRGAAVVICGGDGRAALHHSLGHDQGRISCPTAGLASQGS